MVNQKYDKIIVFLTLSEISVLVISPRKVIGDIMVLAPLSCVRP